MPHRPSHIAEYAALRLGLGLIDHLPLPATLGMARSMGRLAFRLDAKHRRVAVDNVLRAGLADSPAKATTIARGSFESFASTIVEAFRADPLFVGDAWRAHVQLDIHPDSEALLKEPGRGVILLSAHLGNWEVAGRAVSTMKPLTGVARRMNNPLVNKLMEIRKPRERYKMTPKHDADSMRLVKVLRDGEILAMLADQHTPARGMRLPFFGHEASVHTSPALLHLVSGAPLIFGTCIRTGPMQFKTTVPAPITHQRTGNRQEDTRAILTQYLSHIEEAVRQAPAQYLWAHRRWRPAT
jgi:KDO2-lipid IV(A) lauroyltransferase